ncbi:hypothetical protein EJB05_24101, partial [Eragrostis curvula]
MPCMVLLYNYYHRNHFPDLAFANLKQFKLVYLKHRGGDAEASEIGESRESKDKEQSGPREEK